MIAFALFASFALSDMRFGWEVREGVVSANGLRWWDVTHSGLVYSSSNDRRYAGCLAQELGRRQLGPRWWVGRSSQDYIDTRNAISAAAFEASCRESFWSWR